MYFPSGHADVFKKSGVFDEDIFYGLFSVQGQLSWKIFRDPYTQLKVKKNGYHDAYAYIDHLQMSTNVGVAYSVPPDVHRVNVNIFEDAGA